MQREPAPRPAARKADAAFSHHDCVSGVRRRPRPRRRPGSHRRRPIARASPSALRAQTSSRNWVTRT